MNDDSKCPTCGQSLERLTLQSQPSDYKIGQSIIIAAYFRFGTYQGPARVVRRKPLTVEFEKYGKVYRYRLTPRVVLHAPAKGDLLWIMSVPQRQAST